MDDLPTIKEGEKMDVRISYDSLSLAGIARVDYVVGAGGKLKLRAKFEHGVKAILEPADQGKHWEVKRL